VLECSWEIGRRLVETASRAHDDERAMTTTLHKLAIAILFTIPLTAHAGVFDIHVGGICSTNFGDTLGHWAGETSINAPIDQRDSMATATAQMAAKDLADHGRLGMARCRDHQDIAPLDQIEGMQDRPEIGRLAQGGHGAAVTGLTRACRPTPRARRPRSSARRPTAAPRSPRPCTAVRRTGSRSGEGRCGRRCARRAGNAHRRRRRAP